MFFKFLHKVKRMQNIEYTKKLQEVYTKTSESNAFP